MGPRAADHRVAFATVDLLYIGDMHLFTWNTGGRVEMPARDRFILALRQAGHTLAEIGLRIGGSTSAVFARLQHLGTELAHSIGRTP